jgi:hypothetical protein
MIKSTTILNKKERLPWRTIENNTIIVDLNREKVIDLDSVAKEIWDGIDGNNSIDDIVSKIMDTYIVSKETALEDTTSFAGELLHKGLIYEQNF